MSKRKKSPLGKKIEFDSFQALADYINDNLVQVGCEHWTIVPAGNAVHIVRVHSSSTGGGPAVSYGLDSWLTSSNSLRIFRPEILAA